MFAQKFVTNLRKGRKARLPKDVVAEQVRNMLQKSDQKIILMVRG